MTPQQKLTATIDKIRDKEAVWAAHIAHYSSSPDELHIDGTLTLNELRALADALEAVVSDSLPKPQMGQQVLAIGDFHGETRDYCADKSKVWHSVVYEGDEQWQIIGTDGYSAWLENVRQWLPMPEVE